MASKVKITDDISTPDSTIAASTTAVKTVSDSIKEKWITLIDLPYREYTIENNTEVSADGIWTLPVDPIDWWSTYEEIEISGVFAGNGNANTKLGHSLRIANVSGTTTYYTRFVGTNTLYYGPNVTHTETNNFFEQFTLAQARLDITTPHYFKHTLRSSGNYKASSVGSRFMLKSEMQLLTSYLSTDIHGILMKNDSDPTSAYPIKKYTVLQIDLSNTTLTSFRRSLTIRARTTSIL